MIMAEPEDNFDIVLYGQFMFFELLVQCPETDSSDAGVQAIYHQTLLHTG